MCSNAFSFCCSWVSRKRNVYFCLWETNCHFDVKNLPLLSIERYFGGGINLAMFSLMLASVSNLVNKMLLISSSIREAGQIMDSYIVHSNKRLIFTCFDVCWFFYHPMLRFEDASFWKLTFFFPLKLLVDFCLFGLLFLHWYNFIEFLRQR